MTESKGTGRKIGLALSGGGIRAVIFHLGVLRYLAENQLLESVNYISSVSGASLLVGLVFKSNQMVWPSSEEFIKVCLPQIHEMILKQDLAITYIAKLVSPWNWWNFPSRGEILARVIKEKWGITCSIGELPPTPIWAINCTTLETGRRWRFKDGTMGDYMVGYAASPNYELAKAIAASAAFPGGFSPVRVHTAGYDWYTYKSWQGRERVSCDTAQKWPTVHLADGGIYDNLAFEPFFDPSNQMLKKETGCGFIIVSDAGSPLGLRSQSWWGRWTGFSLRVIHIIHAQARSMRIRQWAGFIYQNRGAGLLVDIAVTPRQVLERANRFGLPVSKELIESSWLADDECQSASRYATTLRKPSQADFNCIETLGHQLTKAHFGLCDGHQATA